MRKYLLMGLLLICCMPVMAQYTIRGRVTDTAGNALEYANVALLNDHKLSAAAVSNGQGNYELNNLPGGTYTLTASYGGAKAAAQVFILRRDTTINIRVNYTAGTGLKEVSVSGRRKLIDRKADRLIFNVENSMAAQGVDGIAALDAAPLVKVDEQTGVSLVGKSGVAVMVNDRLLNLSGTDLMNYLRGLRSENIARIEVITTPPAKYEAQGNSGLINIVLKKNTDMGWSGSANAALVKTTYWQGNGGGALNYQGEKLSATVKANYYGGSKKAVETYRIVGPQSRSSLNDRKDMNNGLGTGIKLSYKPDTVQDMGLNYDYSYGHSDMDITGFAKYYTGSTLTEDLQTTSYHRNTYLNHTASAYYDVKLAPASKLSITGNYYYTQPEGSTDFTTRALTAGTVQHANTPSLVKYNIISGQADISTTAGKAQLEGGVKYTYFTNNSDLKYFNIINGQPVADADRTNLFKYNEENYAAYISAAMAFGSRWNAKAGLRYEYATTQGYTPATGERNDYDYGKLFPTAYISYKANDSHMFSLSYAKRINRPNFRALNPFRWYNDPYSYFAGNPYVRPSYNHNIELGYVFNGDLSVTAYYQRVVNGFDQQVELNGMTRNSTYFNFYNQNSTGVNVTYTKMLFKAWEFNLNGTYAHVNAQVFSTQAAGQKGDMWSFELNSSIALNKSKTFYGFVNAWISPPGVQGNVKTKTIGEADLGLRVSLLQKKMQVNLGVNDIFRTAKSLGMMYFTNATHYFDNYYDGRRGTLAVSYRFGNSKVRGVNKVIRFDDKNRAN